jgi:hypothetical protein
MSISSDMIEGILFGGGVPEIPAVGGGQQQDTDTGPSESELAKQQYEYSLALQLQQQQYESAVRAAQEDQRRQNATAVMKGVLTEYGMTALYDRVVGFIKDGYEPDAIMVLIRTTPEYKQRFPAMEALARKGRAMSEGAYIEYERTASGLERRYGIPEGMLMNSVTDLLTNEVSAAELNDRVLLASAAAIQAPDDIKNTFSQYYGIDTGGLTAYFLDPDKATPLLEKQYSSSIIGTEAARQGIGIDVFGAENLASLGITQEEARQGFGRVQASSALTQGRGDVVTQQQLISGTFAQDEQSLQAIERAARGRAGRFQEGGGFTETAQGVSGLGTAATR